MDLKQRIRQINDLTNVEVVRKIRRELAYINTLDPKNKEIIELAKNKGVL